MLRRKAQSFDGHGFADARGIHTAIMKNDAATQGMADQANREIINDVEERGEIEHVLGDTVGSAGSPSAVAVAAQVQRVDMIVLAQNSRDPIPVARMVQAAVHEQQ